MRRIIKKLTVFSIIALLFVSSFWWGENSSVPVENQILQPQISGEWNEGPMLAESGGKEEKEPDAELSVSGENKETPVAGIGENLPSPEKVPEKNAKQYAPQAEEKLACSFSVSCSTVLGNIDRLVPEKHSFIPSNGILYRKDKLAFRDGETVFDVLLREMMAAGIHMEFVKTPIYGNVYIEGIGNLYEFDCGELSGWMYRVNGSFPNFGCDGYKLRNGDEVEWVYTCNLGRDIGGDFCAQNEG